jgi:23S rRNA (uracil1939-C5)-methyltransferase
MGRRPGYRRGVIELTPTDIAHGGEAVARLYGKAHFVAGVMPGERVEGEVVVDKGSWARVELRRVLDASSERVDPPCPHFGSCGGCQWQFADYPAQLRWKQSIVTGQLAHLGGIADPPVRPIVAAGEPFGYRNRMDFRVVDGKPALHRMRSKHLVPLDVCLVLHPDVRAVFESLGDLSGVRRLILRAGVTTGERLAVVEGEIPPHADTWDTDLAQRARSGMRVIRGSGRIHERIDEVTLQITGGAFFQNHTAGAECLVELAGEALAIEAGDTLLDGYAGGGLFGATLGRRAARVVAVEVSPLAVSDLRHNLRAAGVGDHRVVKGAFEEEAQRLDEYWNVAVVDPPREGLGIGGVTAVTAAGPRTIAYVSCDPASLARDTRYLADAGYELDWVTPVDLFPQTFHVEAVARFSRVRPTF